MKRYFCIFTIGLVELLSACGSGDAGSQSEFRIAGSISGLLDKSSVALLINGTDKVSLISNGDFVFDKLLTNGQSYNVTVDSQPAGFQYCAIGNGLGIATQNVDNINVTCGPGKGFVSTLAGSSSPGSNNGPGGTASFHEPVGVAADNDGNVYIADARNREIRKIDPSGTVKKVAGGLTDGSFVHPVGLAVDSQKNIYVADAEANSILKIDLAGNVTNLAGSSASGAADGQGFDASFSYPFGVAVDGNGNVYVSDFNNNMVRKIDPNRNVITIAGSGARGHKDGQGTIAEFSQPKGITLDSQGNLYIADSGSNMIRKIDGAGNVTTVAGSGVSGSVDGSARIASFSGPSGVAVDALNNLYIADGGNNKIRKLDSFNKVSTIAGTALPGFLNGDGDKASFSEPEGLAIDSSGKLYAADKGNNSIRMIVPKTD